MKILIGNHCFNSMSELVSVQRLAVKDGYKTFEELIKFLNVHFSKK